MGRATTTSAGQASNQYVRRTVPAVRQARPAPEQPALLEQASDIPAQTDPEPDNTVPAQYRGVMAMELGGRVFTFSPGDIHRMAITTAAITYARWVSAPALQRLVDERFNGWPNNQISEVVVAHPSCTPKIASTVLDRPMMGTGEDVGTVYIAIADNRALPDDLRRQALAKLIGSNFDVPDEYRCRALLHPLCTDELRFKADNDTLKWATHYMGDAGPEFWQQMFRRMNSEQIKIMLQGPACPSYIRAMWQLANQ